MFTTIKPQPESFHSQMTLTKHLRLLKRIHAKEFKKKKERFTTKMLS